MLNSEAATTVEDVMCDKCRQKVTKTRTKKIRDEPNAFIVNIRRERYFGNDESDSSDFPSTSLSTDINSLGTAITT
jgi:ubiquitin C-terminal hydrolase